MENKTNYYFGAIVALFSGADLVSVIIGFHQDSYGSLDGYIEWLKAPGHWVDTGYWQYLWLVFSILGILFSFILIPKSIK